MVQISLASISSQYPTPIDSGAHSEFSIRSESANNCPAETEGEKRERESHTNHLWLVLKLSPPVILDFPPLHTLSSSSLHLDQLFPFPLFFSVQQYRDLSSRSLTGIPLTVPSLFFFIFECSLLP